MAIILPAHTRGMTAGMLRQIRTQGYTASGGGVFANALIDNLCASSSMYVGPNEPLGKYMNALTNTKEAAEEMTAALIKSASAMAEQAKESQKQLHEISGKLRDGTEKLGLAIEKFNKVAHSADFAEKVKQAQSLVESLERLAALEASGTLDKVMKAMAK